MSNVFATGFAVRPAAMRALPCLLVIAFAGFAGASQIEEMEVYVPVHDILKAQEKAWNEGDIAGYMEHYWKSEELTFSSGGKTTRGWAATKKRYETRYVDRDAMGHLTFSDLEP